MHSESVAPKLAWLVETTLSGLREARAHYLGWRRSRLGLRGTLLYLLALPAGLASVAQLAGGDAAGALAGLGAAFAIGLAAWSNRRGLVDDLVAPDRRYTRGNGPLYKYLAASSLGAGTGLMAAGAADHGLITAALFAGLSIAGYHLVYRLPPPKLLLAAAPGRVGSDRALHKALADAEQRVLAIEKAAIGIGNRELEQRLQRIAGQGRAVLELIAARPDERFRARKFLYVYLEGAERVAERYAQAHRIVRGGELEQNFRNVLIEIERVFAIQIVQLSEQGVTDLDVQIAVLRRQLEHEGIT
jgi:hypothetical protein